MELNVGENILAHEDLAWVELCLNEEPENPENASASLENAEIGKDDTNSSKTTCLKDVGTKFPQEIDYRLPIRGELEKNNEVAACEEGTTPESPTYLMKAFQPHFNDELIDLGDIDLGIDPGISFGFSAEYKEPSMDEVFKVWDLNVLEDDKDLFEELNKLALENADQLSKSGIEASEFWQIETINDLAATISGLSL